MVAAMGAGGGPLRVRREFLDLAWGLRASGNLRLVRVLIEAFYPEFLWTLLPLAT